MTPDETSTATRTEPEPQGPAIAAPARAVRLTAKPVPPPAVRPAPRPAVSSYSQVAPLPAREHRSDLERKLAERGFSRHRTDTATASPPPGPAGPAAARTPR